jgi:hypothetical protein
VTKIVTYSGRLRSNVSLLVDRIDSVKSNLSSLFDIVDELRGAAYCGQAYQSTKELTDVFCISAGSSVFGLAVYFAVIALCSIPSIILSVVLWKRITHAVRGHHRVSSDFGVPRALEQASPFVNVHPLNTSY